MSKNEIEILKKLISYPSITPKECGIYEYIKSILKGFKFIEFHQNDVKNIFFYRLENFSEQECTLGKVEDLSGFRHLSHLCFAGHIDVVPPGDGWRSDPFDAYEENDLIYGRGAQDMKAGVASFIAALQSSTHFNQKKPKAISLLLTSDEEGDGFFGTKYVLEKLQEYQAIPNYVIVAEPTCINDFGDTIKVGRRGSINGVIKIFGKQGHVAYPEKCINPIELLGGRLSKLAGIDLDDGNELFSPSKLVLTDIRSGMEVVNVTPNDLKIMFNIRNNPLTSKEKVELYISEVLEGLNFSLELKQNSEAFISKKDGLLVNILKQNIQKLTQITPTLSTSGGTSDARFFAKYGSEVLEFGVKNDTIHSIDERVSIAEVKQLTRIFTAVIEDFYEQKECE